MIGLIISRDKDMVGSLLGSMYNEQYTTIRRNSIIEPRL
jgi:hypothetical protein